MTTSIIEGHAISNAINYLYPLYQYADDTEIEPGRREPNLSPAFTAHLEQRTGLRYTTDDTFDPATSFTPDDVFHYIYAVFHSPAYRERYDQFLRADFPRVPLPTSAPLFRALAALGHRLVDTHLLRPAALDISSITFPVPGDNTIAKGHPKYTASQSGDDNAPGYVYINRRQHFVGVAPAVWQFRVGGHQPMDKWLKDRRNRTLSFDDQQHYRRIAAAISATIGLMPAIDAAITRNGGLFGNA